MLAWGHEKFSNIAVQENHLEGFYQHRILGPHPQGFWVSGAGMRHKALYSWQVFWVNPRTWEPLLRTMGQALDLSEWIPWPSSSAVANVEKPFNGDKGYDRVKYLGKKYVPHWTQWASSVPLPPGWLKLGLSMSRKMALNQSCPIDTQCEPRIFLKS